MEKTITIKPTGIIRRIDDLGRIGIPKEIRRQLHIKEGDPLEICATSNGIVLTQYRGGFIDEHEHRSLVLSKEEFKEVIEVALKSYPISLDYIEFDEKSSSPVRIFCVSGFDLSIKSEAPKQTVFKMLSEYFNYGQVNAITTDGVSIIITFKED